MLLGSLLLIANAIVGERGLVALARSKQDLAALQAVIDSLRLENGRLQGYARALSDSPRHIEELARGELGMIRHGEQLFVVTTTTLDTR